MLGAIKVGAGLLRDRLKLPPACRKEVVGLIYGHRRVSQVTGARRETVGIIGRLSMRKLLAVDDEF